MKKREWVEIGFACFFDVFREQSYTRKGVKKDGAGKHRPKQNATENTRKKEKAQKLKICRRAKNYGAIRQAV